MWPASEDGAPDAARFLSLDQFELSYGDQKPYHEYWFGEARRKPAATVLHGTVRFILNRLLVSRGYFAAPEVRVNISHLAQPFPDLIAHPAPLTTPYPVAPFELAIEIMSPTDELSRAINKPPTIWIGRSNTFGSSIRSAARHIRCRWITHNPSSPPNSPPGQALPPSLSTNFGVKWTPCWLLHRKHSPIPAASLRKPYPLTYASFAATLPSRTVNKSTPRRCHGCPLRILRYTQRTTARSPLTNISSASNFASALRVNHPRQNSATAAFPSIWCPSGAGDVSSKTVSSVSSDATPSASCRLKASLKRSTTARVLTSWLWGASSKVMGLPCALRGTDEENNRTAAHAAVRIGFFANVLSIRSSGNFQILSQYNTDTVRYLWLLPLLLPSALADTYPRQPSIDVQHYSFHLSLSDETDEIVGEASVTLRLLQPGVTEFSLDLASPANGKGMTVSEVALSSIPTPSTPLHFTHTDNRLSIAIPPMPGDLRTVVIRYRGIPNGGLRIGPDKYNERTFFTDNWPNQARQWLPTIDHPYDKAASEFFITAPAHYLVVANGLLQDETDLGDGRRLTHWKQSVPIASWLNAIAVAPLVCRHFGTAAGVPLETCVYRQDRENGIVSFDAPTRNAVEFFSSHIGPYPSRSWQASKWQISTAAPNTPLSSFTAKSSSPITPQRMSLRTKSPITGSAVP